MRLRDAVLKRSLGRLCLHHLRSAYFVELNESALAAIDAALSARAGATEPGRTLVERLAARGLVEDGAPRPIPMRDASDVVSIEVEPVGGCNLACEHCFVAFSQARMTDEVFERVLAGARALGAIEMAFNGGEPLLHPRCVTWIEKARAADLRVVLFTNGTLVTQEVAERLGGAGVAKAVVSLDGFEPEHDRLRGEGAFSAAVAGIRCLVAAASPRGSRRWSILPTKRSRTRSPGGAPSTWAFAGSGGARLSR